MGRIRLIKYFSTVVCSILILNLFAGTVLYLFIFQGSEKISYSENEKENKEDELEIIKIPVEASGLVSEDFQKMNDHEILFQKKLYDVVKHFIRNGFTYYYCLNDSKEQRILEEIKKCTESHLGYYNSAGQPVPGNFKLFTNENSFSVLIKRNLPVVDFIFIGANEKLYQHIFFEEICPPPEIFLIA